MSHEISYEMLPITISVQFHTKFYKKFHFKCQWEIIYDSAFRSTVQRASSGVIL